MKGETLSPLENAKFTLLNLKLLFSDKNLRFDLIFKEMLFFMEEYEKLDYSAPDKANIIIDFFKLASQYARYFFENNKPEDARKIINFILQRYTQLLKIIHTDFGNPFGEWGPALPHLPHVTYDRAFISYHHALLIFCGKLAMSLPNDSPFFEPLRSAVADIPRHFEGVCIQTEKKNMTELLLYLSFYCTVIRNDHPLNAAFSATTARLKQQFPTDAKRQEEVSDSMQTGSEADFSHLPTLLTHGFGDLVITAFLEFNCRATKSVVFKSKYFHHLEETRDNRFNFLPKFILIRMIYSTFEISLNPHDLKRIIPFYKLLFSDLAQYLDLTASFHKKNAIQYYFFTKNLNNYFLKNLLPSIQHFLDFLKFPFDFTDMDKKIQLGIAANLLSRVEDFLLRFRTRTRRYKKLSFMLEKCQREYESMTAGMDKTSLQKDLAQAMNSLIRDPLDVTYGKQNKINYVVPFPRSMLISKLRDYQQSKAILPSKNLSAHGITLVYTTETYQKGNQHTKKSFSLPIDIPDDNDDVVGSEKTTGEKDVLLRIQQGHDISRQAHMTEQFPLEKPEAFHPLHHSHSEQNFFAYINKHALAIFERLIIPLTKGSKVYMIAFDMGSLRTSCQCCRLSALAVQAAQNEFVAQFQVFLKLRGFEVAGNNSQNGCKLKATTRILADQNNGFDKDLEHINPQHSNIKYLNNLGIFQIKHPGVFISGKQSTARKVFERKF